MDTTSAGLGRFNKNLLIEPSWGRSVTARPHQSPPLIAPSSTSPYLREQNPSRPRGVRQAIRLQRNVPVLALGADLALGLKRLQRGDDLGTRLVRDDHVVDVAALGRRERVGEVSLVVVNQLLA